jgi:hypothetical protein
MVGELLEQTINLYSEPWKPKHDAIMVNYDRADHIKEQLVFGIFLFDQLIAALESGATDNTRGLAPMMDAMLAWYRGSSRALKEIEELDGEGFEVDNAQALRLRHRRAGAILETMQDAARACAAVKNGKAVGVEKFLHELQD